METAVAPATETTFKTQVTSRAQSTKWTKKVCERILTFLERLGLKELVLKQKATAFYGT